MGIRQTLAAIGLSLVAAFSSGAQAQQPRAQGEKHCLTGLIDLKFLFGVLSGTPVKNWTSSYLAQIGEENMTALKGLVLTRRGNMDQAVTRAFNILDRAEKANKPADWNAVLKQAPEVTSKTMAEVKAGKLTLSDGRWKALQDVTTDMNALMAGLSAIKQQPPVCPTVSAP